MRPLRLALTVVSLACSLLLCGLWVRSHGRTDTLFYVHGTEVWDVDSGAGVLEGGWVAGGIRFPDGVHVQSIGTTTHDSIAAASRMAGGWGGSFLGFGIGGWDTYRGQTRLQAARTVRLPHWFPLLLTLIPPVQWWRRRRKHRDTGFPVRMAADVEGG